MKKLILGFLISCAVFLVSCNTKESFDYSQKLVALQKEVLTKTEGMASVPRDSAEKWTAFAGFLNQKINEMKALKVPDGGEDFRDAMVNDVYGLVEFNNVSQKIYDNKDNQSEILRLAPQLDSLKAKLDKLDQKVIDEQLKFAKAHHFKVE